MKSWDQHMIDNALLWATRSKDPATKVGCIITSHEKLILSTGYNGPPRHVRDLPERFERPTKYLFCSHAEENAVAQAARVGASLSGGTAYVTHYPCSGCARMLIQAGIVRVVVGGGETNMDASHFDAAAEMFREAGVRVEKHLPRPE
ncbi:MAG: dCMP deaminase family protein [Devosia sp.]|nr:dCMP deaminase family protein [Devosia sp.]